MVVIIDSTWTKVFATNVNCSCCRHTAPDTVNSVGDKLQCADIRAAIDRSKAYPAITVTQISIYIVCTESSRGTTYRINLLTAPGVYGARQSSAVIYKTTRWTIKAWFQCSKGAAWGVRSPWPFLQLFHPPHLIRSAQGIEGRPFKLNQETTSAIIKRVYLPRTNLRYLVNACSVAGACCLVES